MKRRIIIYCGMLMTLASCQTKYLSTKQKLDTFKKLDILLGTWTTYATVYTVVDTWKKVNDTTLSGSSIMTMKGDTVLNEKMSIITGKGSINYSSKNIMVNEPDMDNFKLTKITSDKITFEKASEKIIYNFISPEVMRILIETEGKSVESYNMRKVIKK